MRKSDKADQEREAKIRNWLASCALEGITYTEDELRFLESIRHLPPKEAVAAIKRRIKGEDASG